MGGQVRGGVQEGAIGERVAVMPSHYMDGHEIEVTEGLLTIAIRGRNTGSYQVWFTGEGGDFYAL
jgi:hypothetical protein